MAQLLKTRISRFHFPNAAFWPWPTMASTPTVLRLIFAADVGRLWYSFLPSSFSARLLPVQFFVTFRALDWMNTKFVAFGYVQAAQQSISNCFLTVNHCLVRPVLLGRQLYEGVDVLQKLEDEPTYNQRPIRDCKIVACGRLGNA